MPVAASSAIATSIVLSNGMLPKELLYRNGPIGAAVMGPVLVALAVVWGPLLVV